MVRLPAATYFGRCKTKHLQFLRLAQTYDILRTRFKRIYEVLCNDRQGLHLYSGDVDDS